MMAQQQQVNQIKKELLLAQISYKKSEYNEKSLYADLHNFFLELKKTVLKELKEYWDGTFMFQGQVDLILAPIFESQKDYYNIILKHIRKEYGYGKAEAKRLVNHALQQHKHKTNIVADKSEKLPVSSLIKKDELFGTSEFTRKTLYNQSFTASENTMNRVDSQINQILSDGYKEGWGYNQVAKDINRRFDQLSDWESRRIARTEIHNAHNMGSMNTYEEMGVEYIQWSSAGPDGRTRDSHLAIDGEIIPIGATFSNGLMYPGDMLGSAEEVINCRCQAVPFIIPFGYIAPSFSPFREDDLISIDVPDVEGLLEYMQFDESKYAKDTASNEFVGWSDKLQRDELGGKLEMEQILTQENGGYTIEELISEETDTLEYWCEEGSSEISNVIYNGAIDEYAQDAITILDDLIESSHGLNQHTKLHAGMILDESLEIGKTSVLKGYQATSFFKEGARPFSQSINRWLVEIHAKKGQKGLCMNAKNGNGFTKYPEEHEYLLPRNQKYIIIQKDVETHTAKILLID